MNRDERRLRDQRIVDVKLPQNTRFLVVDDVDGWLYSIYDQFRLEYKFYVYFDGTYYQVKLVAPELEASFKSSHEGHLFSNGRVCLSKAYDGGMPTIDACFAKSVLWANGITVLRSTGVFPFAEF